MSRRPQLIVVLLAAFAWTGVSEALDRISSADLTYAGSFKLPPWRSNPGGGAAPRWGYGTRALAYDESADALVGSAHVNFNGMVAWASVPQLGERAEELRPFTDVRGALAAGPEFTKVPKLDRHGGLTIVDGRLWASFHTYYAVQSFASLDKPSFVSNSLALDDPKGVFKPGPYGDPMFGQKRTSNYLFTIPKRWADAHVGGKRLGAGKGDGAGSAGNSHGPPIYAVSTEPGPDGVLDSVALVHYPPGRDRFPWNACDEWEGATWVRGTVLIAGRRGTMKPECYGTPQDCGDPCGGGKGYHCQPYRAELLFYDEDDLNLVAHGDMRPHEVVPYETVDLTPTLKDTCSYTIGGMTYDTRRRRVYLVQEDKENPIVHAWDVRGGTSPPDPSVPPSAFRVTVTIDTNGDGRAAEFESGSKVGAVAQAIEYLSKVLREGE